MPPSVQWLCVDGSGPKVRPCCSAASRRSSSTTPGCDARAAAPRVELEDAGACTCEKSITTATLQHWPARLVPPPRGEDRRAVAAADRDRRDRRRRRRAGRRRRSAPGGSSRRRWRRGRGCRRRSAPRRARRPQRRRQRARVDAGRRRRDRGPRRAPARLQLLRSRLCSPPRSFRPRQRATHQEGMTEPGCRPPSRYRDNTSRPDGLVLPPSVPRTLAAWTRREGARYGDSVGWKSQGWSGRALSVRFMSPSRRARAALVAGAAPGVVGSDSAAQARLHSTNDDGARHSELVVQQACVVIGPGHGERCTERATGRRSAKDCRVDRPSHRVRGYRGMPRRWGRWGQGVGEGGGSTPTGRRKASSDSVAGSGRGGGSRARAQT